MRHMTQIKAMAAAGMTMMMAGAAQAQQSLEIVGAPVDRATGFQPAVTELMRDIVGLDNMLNIILAVITVFVTCLLLYAAARFNRRSNPTPATFTHNAPLEIAWTMVPILILVFIGAYSLPVLFKQQEIPTADVVIKATGYQWYWGYEYVNDGVAFDSFMIGSPSTGGDNRMTPAVEAELVAAGYSKNEFLLATDTAVVVPVGKTIVMQVTGADVIHAFAMPAFGVMQSGVPGRISQLWFKAEREGIYFGQCTSLCGQAHAYMPITVKVVSEEVYAKWLEAAKAGNVLLAHNPATAPLTVAAAD